jgi:hypothetical protein
VFTGRSEPKELTLGPTIWEVDRRKLSSLWWGCLVWVWFEGGFTVGLKQRESKSAWPWNRFVNNIHTDFLSLSGISNPYVFEPSLSGGSEITHKNALQSVGLLWTSDQPVAETSTWHTTLTTDNQPCPRRDSNPQSQQAIGRRHAQPMGPAQICIKMHILIQSYWLLEMHTEERITNLCLKLKLYLSRFQH